MYKYNFFVLIVFILCLFLSCEKKDYIETKNSGDFILKIKHQNREIVNSKTYNRLGELQTEFDYEKGIAVKVKEYYPNRKVKSISTLLKLPNHFYTTTYHENGVVASLGECDFVKDRGDVIRRGNWIFYNKNKEPYSILTFANDGKIEYLMRETLFDTIKKTTIKDKKYNPPLPLK